MTHEDTLTVQERLEQEAEAIETVMMQRIDAMCRRIRARIEAWPSR